MKKLFSKKNLGLFLLGLIVFVGGSLVNAVAPAGDVEGFIREGETEQAINTTPDPAYLLSIGGLFLTNDNFAVWNDAVIDIPALTYNDDPNTPAVENANNGFFVGSLGEPDNTPKTVCADSAGKLVLCATTAPLSCTNTEVDWFGVPYDWTDGAVYYSNGTNTPTIVAFCGGNHDLTEGQNINFNASADGDACLTPAGLFQDLFSASASPTTTLMFYEPSTVQGQWNLVHIQQNGVIAGVMSYYGDLYGTLQGTCSGNYVQCERATTQTACQNICSKPVGSGTIYHECNDTFTTPACTWAQCS